MILPKILKSNPFVTFFKVPILICVTALFLPGWWVWMRFLFVFINCYKVWAKFLLEHHFNLPVIIIYLYTTCLFFYNYHHFKWFLQIIVFSCLLMGYFWPLKCFIFHLVKYVDEIFLTTKVYISFSQICLSSSEFHVLINIFPTGRLFFFWQLYIV